jgi:hypothetical protein
MIGASTGGRDEAVLPDAFADTQRVRCGLSRAPHFNPKGLIPLQDEARALRLVSLSAVGRADDGRALALMLPVALTKCLLLRHVPA